MDYYPSMVVGYAVALALWVVAYKLRPTLWPTDSAHTFDRPWREVGYALLAVIGVLLIGQLWLRGIRIPEQGGLEPIASMLNQLFIFSPMILLLIIRKQPPSTAWIRTDRLHWRLGVGLVLALAAVCTFSVARHGAHAPWQILPRLYSYANLGLATQVFLEDFAIAILVVRMSAALGTRTTIVLVACLFAAGHIPTMVTEGASWTEYARLTADAALGIGVISIALRAKDIWWLWCVHFAMDMMQFERISGAAS